MARKRKDKDSPSSIKLRQPDRSAPTEQTLLQLAEERHLFEDALAKEKANRRQQRQRRAASGGKDGKDGKDAKGDDDDDVDEGGLSPVAERIFDTLLWAVSLTTLHVTLDVLAQHQYAVAVNWIAVWQRAGGALLVFSLLVYTLHEHASSPTLLPGLPARYQHPLRQGVFFVASVVAGCYVIYITNVFGYYAVLKQAPPLGCIWVWSVIELDLPMAVLSLVCAGLFLWQGGYDIR